VPTRRDILIVLRRWTALWTLLFWQGGFLFYASAVVPTAQREIGHFQQGLITRQVTVWLNNAAVISLALLALETTLSPDPRARRRRLLWATWLAMVLCQAALFALHPRLEALLSVETWTTETGFRRLHRVYLWVHTVQWAVALAFTALLLASWRANDWAAPTADAARHDGSLC
jgi:hypothetical protein